MNIKTKGIILSRRRYREREQYLTILTEDLGVIEAKLRVFGQINSQRYHAIGVLGYYQFDFYYGKQKYTVNAAEKLEDFYSLREEPLFLALGEYFCELTAWLKPDLTASGRCLSFLLNTLYLLKEKKIPCDLLKAVYQWRILCETGFMPNLVGCASCGCYQADKMFFDPLEGALYCGKCRENEENTRALQLTPGGLQAMRFVALKESREVFGFSLSGRSRDNFIQMAEEYSHVKTEKQFKTLQVYQQMLSYQR